MYFFYAFWLLLSEDVFVFSFFGLILCHFQFFNQFCYSIDGRYMGLRPDLFFLLALSAS